jgi:prepilin-type N-terminal cleavage/methylation domain-containing protein
MKKGFTLAEVLITLSIISVIAILTLPSLVKEYKYKIYGTSIEKTYSQLTDAVQAVMNDEMTNQFYQTTAGVWYTSDCTKGPCYFVKNYLKATRFDCRNATPSCLATEYISTNPENTTAKKPYGQTCAQLNSGAVICLEKASDSAVTHAFIDTNGPAEPNTAGLDAFVLTIRANGDVTDWTTDDTKCNSSTNYQFGHIADYAVGCLTKVMNNGWKITD